MTKLYKERDVIVQGQYYVDHVNAMTEEELNSKSEIAAELAHRDIEIEKLERKVLIIKNLLDLVIKTYDNSNHPPYTLVSNTIII